MTLRFDSDHGTWYETTFHTQIPQFEDHSNDILPYRFQWPQWAIDQANQLIKGGVKPESAIQYVSKLLEGDRNAISHS